MFDDFVCVFVAGGVVQTQLPNTANSSDGASNETSALPTLRFGESGD